VIANADREPDKAKKLQAFFALSERSKVLSERARGMGSTFDPAEAQDIVRAAFLRSYCDLSARLSWLGQSPSSALANSRPAVSVFRSFDVGPFVWPAPSDRGFPVG
jgi:hypothetical protein